MWGRATAGIFPGFFVAAALVGLGSWLLPGAWEQALVPGIVAFFAVWVGVISASFMFANGRRAWLWMVALAVVGVGALWGLQALQWVQ